MLEVLRRLAALALLGLPLAFIAACGGRSVVPPAAETEDPAIAAARQLDKGENLKEGQTREVKTPHGAVTLRLNARGQVEYEKK